MIAPTTTPPIPLSTQCFCSPFLSSGELNHQACRDLLATPFDQIAIILDSPDLFKPTKTESWPALQILIGLLMSQPQSHQTILITRHLQGAAQWSKSLESATWATFIPPALRAIPEIQTTLSLPETLKQLNAQTFPPTWLHLGIHYDPIEPLENYIHHFTHTPFTSFTLLIDPFSTPINLETILPFLNWVIVRKISHPIPPSWIRSLHAQCQQAQIPFYFEGWAQWIPYRQITHAAITPNDLAPNEIAFPSDSGHGWDILIRPEDGPPPPEELYPNIRETPKAF